MSLRTFHKLSKLRRVGLSAIVCASVACDAIVLRAQQQQPQQPPPQTTLTAPVLSRPPAPAAAALPPPAVSTHPANLPAAQMVIAVVHRMSGWKLRALLSPPDAASASTFDESFVHTNIVAGFILPDGRSVIARLPQAEAEMLNLTASFRTPKLKESGEANNVDELLLVRPDGVQFAARFVGLDTGTGLSLLESDRTLLAPSAEIKGSTLSVGQRVRLIAPLPAEVPAPLAPLAPAMTVTTPPQPSPPPTNSDDAPVGDAGVIYMNMSEEPGKLREIKLSPSGRTTALTVEVGRASPEWAGGVALSETGTLVGIVDESHERETRLLSAEVVRGAAERIKVRRASVPQPWLGASGNAVAFTPFNAFVARGWSPAQARTLLERQRGVLLTAVAPGTPAALAGLRAGDVIARIGPHDVSSIEDVSLMIREIGGNSRARFTVLRALGEPLDLNVQLSESANPILDTARAELLAAQSDFQTKTTGLRLARVQISRDEAELRRVETELQNIKASRGESALTPELQKNLLRAREQARTSRERAQAASQGLQPLRTKLSEAQARFRVAGDVYGGVAVKPLLSFGLMAVAISPLGAKYFGGHASGLAVMSVQAGSAAAQANVRIGDIIETINGQPATETNWPQLISAESEVDFTLGIRRDGEQVTVRLLRQTGSL